MKNSVTVTNFPHQSSFSSSHTRPFAKHVLPPFLSHATSTRHTVTVIIFVTVATIAIATVMPGGTVSRERDSCTPGPSQQKTSYRVLL